MKSKKYNLLGLLLSERKILNTFAVSKKYSLAEIVRLAKVPRTTALHALHKLESRGLVSKEAFGKRVVWKKIESEKISKEIDLLVGLSSSNRLTSGFISLSGIESIKGKMWELFEGLPRGASLSGIQTAESALLEIKKIGIEEIARFNKYISDKEIVVTAILEEEYLHKNFKKYGKSWIEGFGSRVSSTVFVPKQYFTFSSEMNIFVNKMLVIDWVEEKAIFIENKEVVTLLKSLFRFMYDNGRKLDNKEIIKMLLGSEKK